MKTPAAMPEAAEIINQETQRVPVQNLKEHPENARRGDVPAIAESIRENGFYGFCVVQRSTGHVLVGNHRLRAAQEAGLSEVDVVFVDVDDERARRIMLADNGTNDRAGYDREALADLLEGLAETDDGLAGTSYGNEDLSALLSDLERTGDSGEGEAAPEDPGGNLSEGERLNRKWGAREGQVWEIEESGDGGGRRVHRLFCGDATDAQDVEWLVGDGRPPDVVFADPPYGISIVQGGTVGGSAAFGSQEDQAEGAKVIPATKYAPVKGDDTTDTAKEAFALLSKVYPEALHVWWGANHYAGALPDGPCWIVWDKKRTGNFADAELAYTNLAAPVRIFEHMWNGMLKDSERGERRQHPNQKPAALCEWVTHEYAEAPAGQSRPLVFVPFAGSGSAIVGAHQAGAAVCAMEAVPAYIAVILERCSAMGLQCERVN